MKRKEIEELIKSAGVTDETEIKKAVDEIMKKNGEDVTPLKSQIETLKEDIEVQKGVVETKNNRIKELEEVDLEQIKKDEYEKGKAEGSKEVEKMRFDSAFDEALKTYKVKDKASIIGHLNMDKIKAEKDESGKITKIIGLEEQIKPLQESKDYLFNSDTPEPTFSKKTNTNTGSNANETLLSALQEKFK